MLFCAKFALDGAEVVIRDAKVAIYAAKVAVSGAKLAVVFCVQGHAVLGRCQA